MAVVGRLVPWPSWAEWAAVRDGLLGEDAAAAADALAVVAAWRSRGGAGGRVPLGLDATAAFVEAKLRLVREGGWRHTHLAVAFSSLTQRPPPLPTAPAPPPTPAACTWP